MIYTEITPNPSTLKFVVDQTLLKTGSADFPNQASASASPLASKLFEYEFVEGVFISSDFVSVTKKAEVQWEEIIPRVKELLKSFLENGEPILLNMPEEVAEGPVNDNETVSRIKKLLDENIRPAVAMDGGDVIFDSFEDGVVRLRLQGACSGCPSSSMTLKMGIEGLLTRMVPEVKTVEAVDA